MKRRSFLATVASLFAAPFVAKKASGYQVAVDPVLNPGEPDRHSVRFVSTNTGRGNELMDRYINGETWKEQKFQLAKWQAWNEKMDNMMKTDFFTPPTP